MTGKFESLQAVCGGVSRETFDRLLAFEATFSKWAARINLTAPSQLPNLWERHILDSAQLLPLGGDASHWLDLGSGGGFPGAVLAILLNGKVNVSVDLIESNRKKAAFLQTALAGISSATIHPQRIEATYNMVKCPDLVTARAVAPLPTLLSLAAPWLERGARGLFQKGRDYRAELEESRDGWQFDLVKHPSRIDPDGVILEVAGLRRKPVVSG